MRNAGVVTVTRTPHNNKNNKYCCCRWHALHHSFLVSQQQGDREGQEWIWQNGEIANLFWHCYYYKVEVVSSSCYRRVHSSSNNNSVTRKKNVLSCWCWWLMSPPPPPTTTSSISRCGHLGVPPFIHQVYVPKEGLESVPDGGFAVEGDVVLLTHCLELGAKNCSSKVQSGGR